MQIRDGFAKLQKLGCEKGEPSSIRILVIGNYENEKWKAGRRGAPRFRHSFCLAPTNSLLALRSAPVITMTSSSSPAHIEISAVGSLLQSFATAALPIVLAVVIHCMINRRAEEEAAKCAVDGDEDYLLDATVPYLFALQNIYADAKHKGVRFGGRMERVDSMAGRSGKVIGAVWDQIREVAHSLSAEEIRRAVRMEYDEFPAENVEWHNYEDDEEEYDMNAPSDEDENEISSEDSDVVGDGTDEHDSDATNYSLPRSYLMQLDAESAVESESDETNN